MGAFVEDYDEPILRIPPVSPSRRDYQLRSPSPSPSRPQSPWRPREQVSGQGVDTFLLYESNPPALARSNYYSGPLPSVPQGVDRSFYSGPLPGAPQGVDRSYYSGPLPTITPPQPSFSGPLSGVSATTTESFDFDFSTWAKGYHRQYDSSSRGGSLDIGSSQEGKSVRGHNDDDADSADDEPSSFYLKNPAESRARAAAEFAERAGKYGRDRNCVSGELGISDEIAKQKSQVVRGYKSGEISGLNICADGIYTSSPRDVSNVVDGHEPHRHSGATAAWNALMSAAKKENYNAKDDDSNCNSEMVSMLFKWEGVSEKPRDSVVPNKRSSRSSTKQNSRSSSTSTKPNSRTSSTSTVSQKPNSRTSSTSTVSQKPNSRMSSTSTVPQKPNSRTSSTSSASQKLNSRTSSTATVSKKPNSQISSTAPVSKKPNSQTSSIATQEVKAPRPRVKRLESEFSFGGSHKFYGIAAKAADKEESVREEAEYVGEQAESVRGSEASVSDCVAHPALKPLRTTPASKAARQQGDSVPKSPFAVPFKWEDEPGKAKLDVESKTNPEELVPALQLPPRLVSASVKSRSPASSTKPTKASAKQSRSGSTSEVAEPITNSSVGNHSREGSGIPSSRKFFDKDCFRRCRRLLVNMF